MHDNCMPAEMFFQLLLAGWLVVGCIIHRAYEKWKERILKRQRMYPDFYSPYDKEEEAIQKMCRFLDNRISYVKDLISEHDKEFLEELPSMQVTHWYPPYPEHLHALFHICAILKLKIIIIEEKDFDKVKDLVADDIQAFREYLKRHPWVGFSLFILLSVGSILLLTLFLYPNENESETLKRNNNYEDSKEHQVPDRKRL